MGEQAIEAENLTRDYGTLRAVDHISFAVQPGEVFGFLGPNGAGKTTTVRMLTTLLAPTEGTARIFGYDVNRQSYRARRQMGIVPEESNVYTELSAWDNLIFTARLYRVPRDESERQARELLKTFTLWEKRSVKAEAFSKGMKRKLTIAMSLLHSPRVLFLDEPTSGLDVQSALTIKEIVRQLNAEGTTVFLTTHRIEEASQLCDRVAIINHGRITAIDTPEQLKRDIQSVQSVEVSLGDSRAEDREVLAALVGVTKAVKQGDKMRLYTADPPLVLQEVMAYAQAQGRRVLTLNTLGPSLEDVFMHITGGDVGTARKEPADGAGGKRHGRRRR